MSQRRWPWAPAPYSPQATPWNVPVQLREAPWGAVRSHSDPSLIDPSQRLDNTMWLPRNARTAFPSHPQGGLEAVSNAQMRLAALASSALAKSAMGLPATQDEAAALLVVRMPPVYRQQIREGVGAQVRSNRVPPVTRGGVLPTGVVIAAATLRNPTLATGAASTAGTRAASVVDRIRESLMLPVLRDLARRL